MLSSLLVNCRITYRKELMGAIELIGIISGIVSLFWFGWFVYEKYFPFRRLSWKLAQKAANNVANKMVVDNYMPSLIFGIGRGGAIFGALISGCFGHRPLVVLDRRYNWSERGRIDDVIFPMRIPSEYLKSVLLVAGEAHSGGTMNRYFDYLKALGADEIRRAVLYLEDGCVVRIDYHGIKGTKKNILMPWMFSKQYQRTDRLPGKLDDNIHRTVLYLVRHAETVAGEDRFVGVEDYELTLKGIEQSLTVGRFFLGEKVKIIFASPLGRAMKTGKIVQGFVPESEFIADDNLREMDFGKWDGLMRKDVQKKSPELYKSWSRNPLVHLPPSAEKPEVVLARMKRFLEEIEKRHKNSEDQEFIGVSHKTALRILLAHLQGMELSEYRTIDVPNAKVFKLMYDGKQWILDQSSLGGFQGSQ